MISVFSNKKGNGMNTAKVRNVLSVILLLIFICFFMTGCGEESNGAIASADSVFAEIIPNSEGYITIPTEEVTQNVRFYNYDAEGVMVQLVTLRDKAGDMHIAFNTCQSCSPSPKAYYSQDGEVLMCNNCGFTFEPEQVGITHGGCNPWPVEGVSVGTDEITVPAYSLDDMRDVFSTWNGPVE